MTTIHRYALGGYVLVGPDGTALVRHDSLLGLVALCVRAGIAVRFPAVAA